MADTIEAGRVSGDAGAAPGPAGRPARAHREFRLTEEEFELLERRPGGQDWPGARMRPRQRWPQRGARPRQGCAALREALGELIRAAGLVRRIGVNLNQAVARLNATGQRSG